MSEHIREWLAAYHDGELGERRTKRVKAHLKDCEICRVELKKLSNLRLMLLKNPGVRDSMPLDRFVSQVGLRLQYRSPRTTFQRTLVAAWAMIPVGLLGIWAFAQALSIVVHLMGIALDFGLWSELALVFSSTSQGALLSSYSWKFGVSMVTGLISLSWLASWWINQQSTKLQKTTE